MNKHIITVTSPLDNVEAVIKALAVEFGETTFEAGSATIDMLNEELGLAKRRYEVLQGSVDRLQSASERAYEQSRKASNEKEEILEHVRQYIIDEELQGEEFAMAMIEQFGMRGFTRSGRVRMSVSVDVIVDFEDVSADIDEDDLEELIVEKVSESVCVAQQRHRFDLPDGSTVYGDAEAVDVDVDESSIEFED